MFFYQKRKEGYGFSLLQWESLANRMGIKSPEQISRYITGIYILSGCFWLLIGIVLILGIIENKTLSICVGIIHYLVFIVTTAYIIKKIFIKIITKVQEDTRTILENYKDMSMIPVELDKTYKALFDIEKAIQNQNELVKEKQKLFKQNEEKYERLISNISYKDSLTDLPNRLALEMDWNNIKASDKITEYAVFFIDLDNFKLINDILGQEFGDRFLIKIGNSICTLIKDKGKVYRIGGDEFAIVLQGINNRYDVEQMADKMLDFFTRPLKVDYNEVHIKLNIGIALYPEHGDDIKELLRCADIAMYGAKNEKKGNYMLYHASMNKKMLENLTIEKHLYKALELNELSIFYQPQYDIELKRITGFEALLRWNNSELGSVSPSKFIPIAEENRLIIPIGEWVIDQACCFAGKLTDMGIKKVVISINVSILQLMQDNFIDIVKSKISEYKLEYNSIELEITESILMESYDIILEKLIILGDLGVRIALDDFGKGYSSLNYLKTLPINTLKIDKSFIDGILNCEKNRIVTEQIFNLGRRIGLTVIAEGVELEEQFEYLDKNKCDKIQGYIFSKPLAAQTVFEFLKPGNVWEKLFEVKM